MKKSFLAILLVLLVVLIGYQVYQNRLNVSGHNDQAKVIKPVGFDKTPIKKIETSFENASSTIGLIKNNANNTVNGMFVFFVLKVNAGAKPVNLPIGAQIDLLNLTASSVPVTIASVRATPMNQPGVIQPGKSALVPFQNMFVVNSTVPAGTYKAVLRQVYVGEKSYEVKMGTNVVVYTP